MHPRGPGFTALALLPLLLLAAPAQAAPKAEIDHLDGGGGTRVQFVAPAGTTCKVDKGAGIGALEREGASFTFDAAGGKAYSFWCKLPDGTPWASKVFARGGKVTRISLNGAAAALAPQAGGAPAPVAEPPLPGAPPDTAPVDGPAPALPGGPAATAAPVADPGGTLTGPPLHELLRSLRRAPYTRERLELADEAFDRARPPVESVVRILELFDQEHDRLRLFSVLGDRLADPERTPQLLRTLSYEGDRLRAGRLLRGAPVAPAWY